MQRSNEKKVKYFTFPITILSEAFIDIRKCMNNVMSYCLYDYFIRHGYNFEDLSFGVPEAESFFEMKYGDKRASFESGKMIYDKTDEKCPKTSIRKDMVFDYLKNKKSEFEIASFLAFAALKSIIQRGKYKKITNQYFLSRMAGCAKKTDTLPEFIKKYTSRYQLDKLKKELELNWGLKLYGRHSRGFYFSFSLDLKDLVKIAEARRKSNRSTLLANMKKEYLREVLADLNIHKSKLSLRTGLKSDSQK